MSLGNAEAPDKLQEDEDDLWSNWKPRLSQRPRADDDLWKDWKPASQDKPVRPWDRDTVRPWDRDRASQSSSSSGYYNPNQASSSSGYNNPTQRYDRHEQRYERHEPQEQLPWRNKTSSAAPNRQDYDDWKKRRRGSDWYDGQW